MHKNINPSPRPDIPPSRHENILNEPEAIYENNRLRHFHSFEDMNEADAKEMANASPETHLRNVTMLIEKIFSEELKQRMDKTVKFKK